MTRPGPQWTSVPGHDCLNCGQPLVRREFPSTRESRTAYVRRRYCGDACRRAHENTLRFNEAGEVLCRRCERWLGPEHWAKERYPGQRQRFPSYCRACQTEVDRARPGRGLDRPVRCASCREIKPIADFPMGKGRRRKTCAACLAGLDTRAETAVAFVETHKTEPAPFALKPMSPAKGSDAPLAAPEALRYPARQALDAATAREYARDLTKSGLGAIGRDVLASVPPAAAGPVRPAFQSASRAALWSEMVQTRFGLRGDS